MSETTLALEGGDDSGSETFARYRYQSKLTLFHWLGTLVQGGPRAVLAEHVEDILLDYGDRLVFIQVKTRAPTVGNWTSDGMCSSGGGIDSLCRAYAIAKDSSCTFGLYLEGSTSPSKGTADFVRDCATASAALRTKITAHMQAASLQPLDGELDDFLSRLTVVPNQPSQSDIDAKCFRALCRLSPESSVADMEELYKRLLQIVEDAQQALPPGLAADATGIEFLEAQLTHLLPGAPETDVVVVLSKRLTRERLAEILPPDPDETALLLIQRVLDDRPLTALEEKLLAAGATNSVVSDARQLRAMAEPRRIELLAGPEAQLQQLDDVSNRVLVHARAVAQLTHSGDDPTNDLWARLVATTGLESTDQSSLFNEDRQSLLGLLCCLSDECKFGWKPS